MSSDQESIFINACTNGNVHALIEAINNGIDRNEYKRGLELACFNSHIEIINILIDEMDARNILNSKIISEVFESAFLEGHSEIMSRLIEIAKEREIKINFGYCFFHADAIRDYKNLEIIFENGGSFDEYAEFLIREYGEDEMTAKKNSDNFRKDYEKWIDKKAMNQFIVTRGNLDIHRGPIAKKIKNYLYFGIRSSNGNRSRKIRNKRRNKRRNSRKHSRKNSRKTNNYYFEKTKLSDDVIMFKLKKEGEIKNIVWKEALKIKNLGTLIQNELIHFRKRSYFFECAPITSSLDSNFVFVITFSDDLNWIAPNSGQYSEYLKNSKKDSDFVSFPNLGQTGILVIPKDTGRNYSDLRNFIINGGNFQKMFEFIKKEIKKCFDERNFKKIYLSTHGHGVPWLHFRIFQEPKYYSFYFE
jgi:hypothetical protein